MEEKNRHGWGWRLLVAAAVVLIMTLLAACARYDTRSSVSFEVQHVVFKDPHSAAGAIIEQFDLDSDERVSADEFALATIRVFETVDKKPDLKVDRDELGPVREDVLSAADTNHDGAISLSEIMRDQDRQVKNYDRDGDGYLTLDDLERFAADRLPQQQMR